MTRQQGAVTGMRVRSEAFGDGEPIPLRDAAESAGGDDLSPPLSWEDVPDGTVAFAVTAIDRHRVAGDFVHWAVVGLPAETRALPEGASGSMPPEARELTGTSGATGWHGPSPPRGSGAHPYEFTVWALSEADIRLPHHPDADALARALQPVALGTATITGTYER